MSKSPERILYFQLFDFIPVLIPKQMFSGQNHWNGDIDSGGLTLKFQKQNSPQKRVLCDIPLVGKLFIYLHIASCLTW